MNKFDNARAQLDDIQNDILTNGVNEENLKRLNDLFSGIKLVIALGPTETFVREKDNPDLPDHLDFEYYSECLTQDLLNDVFKDERWGSSTSSLELRNHNGSDVPALVIKWEHYDKFFEDQSDTEELGKKINGFASVLVILLGLRWYNWSIEVV